MRIAVFDIGTNSIHMKIVEVNGDFSFEVLDHEKDMTRIGDGSFKARRLSKRAIRRALKVIERFSRIARENKVKKTVAIATSAVRDAENGADFVKQVYKKTGIRVRVVSGGEEARLIFLGASSANEKIKGRVLSVDIGGGSMELVLGSQRKIDFAESLPLGVARLSDRFISKDPPSKENLRGLQNHIEDMMRDVTDNLLKKGFSRVLGTGGTLINLASLIYEAREGRRLRLRGYFEIKRKELGYLAKKLVRLSRKKLKKLPGLDKKRDDIIIAGVVLAHALMRLLRADGIFVSDKGVREGLILDYLVKNRMKAKNPPPSLRVQWFGQKPYFSGRIIR